jgi:uncharacterized membrane protein
MVVLSSNKKKSIILRLVLACLLLVVSLAALLLGIIARSIPGVIAAVVGFAMTLLAYLSGVSFLSYGQQSASSLSMSLGFLGAMLAYLLGYDMTRPSGKGSENK